MEKGQLYEYAGRLRRELHALVDRHMDGSCKTWREAVFTIMKERVPDAAGYDYSGILLHVRDPALEKKLQQEADSSEEDMEAGPEEEAEGLSMDML